MSIRTHLFSSLSMVRRALSPLGVERFGPARRVYHSLKKNLKTDVAEFEGHRFYLDEGDSLDLSINPRYENFSRELTASFLRKGDCVLDIGAHIGFFTLHFARIVGTEGRVFAFEPSPENFRLLEENVAENGYMNVEPIEAAVADKGGSGRLYLHPENSGDHRLSASEGFRDYVEVEQLRLDDFIPLRRERIDFIKMDIQGAELRALGGMEGLLGRNPHLTLLIEFWPAGLARFGTAPGALLTRLDEGGFQIRHLNEDSRRLEPVEDLAGYLERFDWDEGLHTNLWCEGREAERKVVGV